MDTIKTSGVYVLGNVITGERYIGSSTGLEARRRSHFTELKRGIHGNRNLQNAYNQYGKAAFKFTVLEYCKSDDLIDREQHWMDVLHPEYNINKQAGLFIDDYIRTDEAMKKRKETYQHNKDAGKHKKRVWEPKRGKDHPNFGKHWPKEMRDRISQSLKGEKNPGYGKRRSQEICDRIGDAHAKTYPGMISPDGVVYAPIVNMSAFCREHSLNVSHAVAVMRGKLQHHKGWTKYDPSVIV